MCLGLRNREPFPQVWLNEVFRNKANSLGFLESMDGKTIDGMANVSPRTK